ncbi:MPN449 family protein [Mycoplasma sp. E35C]|uniref:MPN449 family protein n=1 Tax=Mycoplasma sp. E35C TaxID=2801918 RepID=UPI001CA4007E|nr:hypothetical protein [Mycoplasma sp. E35C]QZX49001.1 hypothetical protein JJE79_03015 [Mycoplasma sp. E35C]
MELNQLLDKIKFKLNAIFNTPEFSEELKKNEAFRGVVLKQIAIYKFVANKAENASTNLETVDFLLEKLNQYQSIKTKSEDLKDYKDLDDAIDDANYLDIFILNTFNKSIDEIINKNNPVDSKVDDKLDKSSINEADNSDIKKNFNEPTVTDVDEKDLESSFAGSRAAFNPSNMKDIFEQAAEQNYRSMAASVVKLEADIGNYFLFKQKHKGMLVLNYLAAISCFLFALLNLIIIFWYLTLNSNQQIPDINYIIQGTANPVKIVNPGLYLIHAMLIFVSVFIGYRYVMNLMGKTPQKILNNALNTIKAYTNRDVDAPNINDNLRFSFKFQLLFIMLVITIIFSFIPVGAGGGSYLDLVKEMNTVDSKISFPEGSLDIAIARNISTGLWILLLAYPISFLVLIFISWFFKPTVDHERLDATIDQYTDEIKKTAKEAMGAFFGQFPDKSSSGAF